MNIQDLPEDILYIAVDLWNSRLDLASYVCQTKLPSVNTAAMEMISIVKLTLRFDFLLTNEILEAASTLPRLNTLEIQNVRLVEIHQ